MALAVVSNNAAPESDAERELIKECLRRVERADLDRNRHQSRMSDCYKFALPWRHKLNASQPTDQLDEIFDATAMTVVEDFAADMLNTFTPMKNAWVAIKPVLTLDSGDQRMIQDKLREYQDVLFAEMARSNLYQALPESYLDLSVGTLSMIIQDINPAEPIHCQAIPVTELLIDRGPYGYVDGKWRKRKLRAEDIPVLWPQARPLDAAGWKPGDTTEHEVIDGCWRDWSDRGTEAHRYVVLAGSKLIYEQRWYGAGSCPFITARWSRDSTTAWGVGPLYRSTPDVKTLNHVKFVELKNHDKHSDPVVSYEDDGVINVDQGVTPGTWVPRAQGSKAPEVIEARTSLDRTVFQIDQLQSAIKRAHYQDRPEQLGKTPPTAAQWADEAAERARRMGSVATNLVQELQYPIIKRFAYLLAKRGVLPKIELNGREISVEPVSPLLRAQEQEEVIRLDRYAEMIAARFGPQVAMVVIDLVKYAGKLAALLGVEKELIRNEADIGNAIQQLLPVLKAATAGPQLPAPGPAGYPPPTAQPGAI